MQCKKQPLNLNLTRKSKNTGKAIPGIPVVHNKRGRCVYNWDAIYLSGVHDPWTLAEELDETRKAEESAKAKLEKWEHDRLKRLFG